MVGYDTPGFRVFFTSGDRHVSFGGFFPFSPLSAEDGLTDA